MKREYCRGCGAPIEFNEQIGKYVCEYCFSVFEKGEENEEKTRIKEKASALFKACDFDGAKGLYQTIVATDDDAEAYWFITLCKYGIQFVDDPRTGKKIPTCHRTIFTPILLDEDYSNALHYADALMRESYEKTAEKINDIQKGIIEIVNTQKPYDIFICYKETGENGLPTKESNVARDLYYKLIIEGYRVFYAPETLQSVSGYEFEPYIYAAISSAKIMFVIGFVQDHYNAVWVKNEWSRFLFRKSQNNLLRLSCCFNSYVDSNPIPAELSSTQAIDLKDVSTNDLVLRVQEWLPKKKAENKQNVANGKKELTTVGYSKDERVAPLLERVFMFLEDEEWESADEYCEKVLDIDPKNGEAYLGKLMVELEVKSKEELRTLTYFFDDDPNYSKILRFGNEDTISYLKETNKIIENNILEEKYCAAVETVEQAKYEHEISKVNEAKKVFGSLGDFKNSYEMYLKCDEKIKEIHYKGALKQFDGEDTADITKAKEIFKALGDFKNSSEMYVKCDEKIKDIDYDLACEEFEFCSKIRPESLIGSFDSRISECQKVIDLFESLEGWRDSENKIIKLKCKIFDIQAREKKLKKRGKRKKLFWRLTVFTVIFAIIGGVLYNKVIEPKLRYDEAVELMETGKYKEAITIFESLSENRDCDQEIEKCRLEDTMQNLKSIKKGDVIYLGKYNQDGYINDGNEAIEWIVLDAKDGKALVISKYMLDVVPYNTTKTEVTWENCSLRAWLNDDFYKTTFSNKEKGVIAQTTVINEDNDEDGTDGGNDTVDRIFCLSKNEVESYFSKGKDKMGKITYYTYKKIRAEHETQFNEDRNTYAWWYRTPGFDQTVALTCSYWGGDSPYSVNYEKVGVRPAMWINLT